MRRFIVARLWLFPAVLRMNDKELDYVVSQLKTVLNCYKLVPIAWFLILSWQPWLKMGAV